MTIPRWYIRALEVVLVYVLPVVALVGTVLCVLDVAGAL